jgi:hypothetical protein
MGRRRTLGYVQLEWTCPSCGTRNKGGVKTCENCGAPQAENVQFDAPSEKKFVTDEEQLKAAQAGADIHCGFCGTRNPAAAETCSQCGGDLKEGKARQAGRILQTPPPQPKFVTCTRCGTENPGSNSVCSNCGAPLPKVAAPQAAPSAPAVMNVGGAITAKKKTNWFLIGGILAFLAVCCMGIGLLFLVPSSSVEATVISVHWETYVPVQEMQSVNYSDQRGSPPSNAYNVSCRMELETVCEERTVDDGTGYGRVEEVCHDNSTQFCSYTLDEWRTIQTYTLEGNDLQPVYESPSVGFDQRVGDASETLTVYFLTEDGEQETYNAGSVSEFQQFTPGSTWTLNMNLAGGVVSVEP